MADPQFANSGEMVSASLRGYRSWSIKHYGKTDWRLSAVTVGEHWKSKEMTAECVKLPGRPTSINVQVMLPSSSTKPDSKNHTEIPVAECTCGIYGWYEPENAIKLHTGAIVGVVEFSGRILMGTMGFRAEKAKIIGLTLGKNYSAAAEVRNAIDFIENISKYIDELGGVRGGVKYGRLQSYLKEKEEINRKEGLSLVQEVAVRYGVEAFRSVAEMKDKYPPYLDTVENILGNKLKRYNGNPAF